MTDVTLTYNCGTNDCWGSTWAHVFDSTGTEVYVGEYINQRAWFPFVLTLHQKITVVSATLKITGSFTSGSGSNSVNIGAEAADNPAIPTNETDLLARTMTSAVLATSIPAITKDVIYSYDITSAIQEVLNRSGWASGNTLAVIIHNTDAGPNIRRIYSANRGSGMAQLVIVVRPYVPKAMFLG